MELGFVNAYRDVRYRNYVRVTAWMQGHETAVKAAMALAMALAIGALAQVSILTPLTPVPYTLQVFGVALAGGLLGRTWGTVSVVLYLLLGIIGLPLFAGEVATYDGFEFGSGWGALTGLTGGYLWGFVVQAFLVGWMADRRTKSSRGLLTTAAATGLVLTAFILLDAYALAQAQHTAYYTSGVQALFLGVLVAGELVVIGALGWLAFTTKARRERIELFMANLLGVAALYTVGALVFFMVFTATGQSMGAMDLLRATVLPFIPADLTKILVAIGILTLLRPTHQEISSRRPGASAHDV